MDLSQMLDAASAGDPVPVKVGWDQLPRTPDGKWAEAEFDMFGRPVVHVTEE